VNDDPPDYWSGLFEADDLATRVAILRALVRSAVDRDPSALQLLLGMLPAVDVLLADVQAALGRRTDRARQGAVNLEAIP
jgi:hypothetical protein